MNESAEISVDSAANARVQNQLTLAHVFLWISATAVILALVRPAFEPTVLGEQANDKTRQLYEQRHRNTLVFLPTIAPIWGLGLAAVALAGWRRVWGGPAFPTQPGHWMLLIFGSFVLALLPILLSISLDHDRGLRNLLIFLGWLAAVFLPFSVIVGAAFRIRGPAYWQLFLGGLAASTSVFVVGWIKSEIAFRFWGYMASTSGSIIAFGGLAFSLLSGFALTAAPILDLFAQEKFDYLHWIGATLLLVHFIWCIGCLAFLNLTA